MSTKGAKGTAMTIVNRWGRFPLFQAKIGTMPGCLVMIRRQRLFTAGEIVKYATLDSVKGMCVGCTPRWESGMISKVGEDRLFIDRY